MRIEKFTFEEELFANKDKTQTNFRALLWLHIIYFKFFSPGFLLLIIICKNLNFQNLEAELSKKCDELRQLFLLQQSQQQHASEDTNSTATPSPPTSTTSVLRALRKPSGEQSKYRRSSNKMPFFPLGQKMHNMRGSHSYYIDTISII